MQLFLVSKFLSTQSHLLYHWWNCIRLPWNVINLRSICCLKEWMNMLPAFTWAILMPNSLRWPTNKPLTQALVKRALLSLSSIDTKKERETFIPPFCFPVLLASISCDGMCIACNMYGHFEKKRKKDYFKARIKI